MRLVELKQITLAIFDIFNFKWYLESTLGSVTLLLLTASYATVRGDLADSIIHFSLSVGTVAHGQPLLSSEMVEADSSFNIIKPPSITGTVCHCWQNPLPVLAYIYANRESEL